MRLAEKKRGIQTDLGVYPQIRNEKELTDCLKDARVIEACGFQSVSSRRALKELLQRTEKGVTVLFKEIPSGWPAEGVLICTEGLSSRGTERLLRKLYDADCVILGVVTEAALGGWA